MQKIALLLILFLGLSKVTFAQTFFEVDSIQDADVKVYYVEDEADCDLKICFVYTADEAKEEAHWCEVGDPSEADIKIIFVDTPELADINLCVAFEPTEAKWLNEDLKKKFKF